MTGTVLMLFFRLTPINPIAVRDVDQYIALAVEETDDLKAFEHEAPLLVEDALAVLELADDFYRTDRATGDAGVTRILRHAQSAFNASCLRTADVAGDTLHLGIVEGIDHDFVVGSEPAKMRADRAGRTAFGAIENPPSEEHNDQENPAAQKNPDPFHGDLSFFSIP